jgi:putative hydrolase of the HAD superfamily
MQKIKGIIFDFGDVISQPQDENCLAEMAGLLELEAKNDFKTVYRNRRRDYDWGIPGTDYWTGIINHYGQKRDAGIIAALIGLDIRSWARIKPEVVVLIQDLKDRGYIMALLSNMPLEIRDYFKREAAWLRVFDHTVFSCDLKLLKPDAAIYRYCLAQMGLEPEECLFIDDVPENIAAARSCGIAAIRFQTTPQVMEELQDYLG